MNRIELSSFIKIPMNEQESVLRWEAGEREFCFYTSDKNEIKKILRMMDEHPDDIRVKHADKYGIEVPLTVSGNYRLGEDGCMYDRQGKDGL